MKTSSLLLIKKMNGVSQVVFAGTDSNQIRNFVWFADTNNDLNSGKAAFFKYTQAY